MTILPEEDPRDRLRRLLASEDETMPELPTADEESGGSPSDATIASVMASLGGEEEESSELPTHTSTPDTPMPALDKANMPLPRRVDEIDVGATRVTPAAYNVLPKSNPARPAGKTPSQPIGARPAASKIPSRPPALRSATQ